MNLQFGDYSESVQRLIKVVAEVEQRSQLSILEDIDTIVIGDVVRLRSFDELNRSSSTLPFDDGLILLNRGKDMLNAAARAVIEKREVYPSQRPAPVSDYLKKLRLGQTEQGSFIVKLISPISEFARRQLSLPEMGYHEPFERKVVVGLMNSLHQLNEVAVETFKRGRFYFDAFQELVDDGVSANLCEAITDATSETKKYRPLEVSVTWSYVLKEVPVPDVSDSVVISPNGMAYIEQAGLMFREKNPENVTLEGYVIVLKREKFLDVGEITLVTIVDGRQRNVRVELERELYLQAIHAHENELKVSIEGQLVKKGRLTFLQKAQNLEIIEDEF